MARITPGAPQHSGKWRLTQDVLASTPRAAFSPCEQYRYTLWREWGLSRLPGYVMFIGLNPSTADDRHDDPTVARCIAFAKKWGYSGMCMTNLFALRATEPAHMVAHPEPVGPENDAQLAGVAGAAALRVAAWGVGGDHLARAAHVRRIVPDLHCLRMTKGGHPGHPLYLPGDLQPIPWG